MSLVGDHIHRLMINSLAICNRTQTLMLESIPVGSATAEEDCASIEWFMGRMLELMEAFDLLCAVMNKTAIQSEETIENFGLVAKWFGVKYREYFNKLATPKVHYLETHLVEDLRKHKRTGLFDESPIERAHRTNNVYSHLFVNIKNWFDRQTAIEMRSHIADVPDVHKAVYGIEEKSSRESSEKAMERKVALNERKKQKRDDTVARITGKLPE
jgi:hypothetical protein